MWLRLWVRCWVYPLWVRLLDSPLPSSQSTFHLCAVGCKSRWKWRNLRLCVVLDFCSSHPIIPLKLLSKCQGSSEHRWELRREGVDIHHQPLALGSRTRGYPADGLHEKIAGEVSSSSRACGSLALFTFFVCVGLFLSHCLHTVFMWQLAHIIWFGRKCGRQLKKHHSDYFHSKCHLLLSVLFKIDTDEGKQSLNMNSAFMSRKRYNNVPCTYFPNKEL